MNVAIGGSGSQAGTCPRDFSLIFPQGLWDFQIQGILQCCKTAPTLTSCLLLPPVVPLDLWLSGS